MASNSNSPEPIGKTVSTILSKTRSSWSGAQPPDWYANSVNSKLPDECRAKCELCRGRGSHSGLAVYTCLGCKDGYEPCPLHTCPQCGGSGLCCPKCRGMRFLRAHEFDVNRGTVVQVIRCDCCEGNNVSAQKELQLISRYMLRWRTNHDRYAPKAAGDE